jgi:hypothetical protein
VAYQVRLSKLITLWRTSKRFPPPLPQVESLTQRLESSDAEVRQRVADRTEQLLSRVREMEAREEQLQRQLQAANSASELGKIKQVRLITLAERDFYPCKRGSNNYSISTLG